MRKVRSQSFVMLREHFKRCLKSILFEFQYTSVLYMSSLRAGLSVF